MDWWEGEYLQRRLPRPVAAGGAAPQTPGLTECPPQCPHGRRSPLRMPPRLHLHRQLPAGAPPSHQQTWPAPVITAVDGQSLSCIAFLLTEGPCQSQHCRVRSHAKTRAAEDKASQVTCLGEHGLASALKGRDEGALEGCPEAILQGLWQRSAQLPCQRLLQCLLQVGIQGESVPAGPVLHNTSQKDPKSGIHEDIKVSDSTQSRSP